MARLSLLVLALVVVSCGPTWSEAYIAEARKYPLTFAVSNEKATGMWARANVYFRHAFSSAVFSEDSVSGAGAAHGYQPRA